MKIAYLARRPIPSVHAHSVQIVKMCEAFGKIGHEVTLFAVLGDDVPSTTYSRYGVEPLFEIQVHPKRMQRFRKPRFVAWLLRQPGFKQADLYFGRDITSLAAAARYGKPVIYEAHAIPPPRSSRWKRLARLFASDNFSHLVCVTSTLAELHREQFPALANKPILVVPNAAAEVPPGQSLEEWPGRPGAVKVGFVGRPFAGKGIELMIGAAGKLPALDFHVVGANEEDLTWIEGDLPSNLYLHGYQPHSRLGGFYTKFDISVAPYGAKVMNASRIESAAITSPLKLLEYMAAGLPSIVSDLPGVGDIVRRDGEGVTIVVPPGDEEAFVKALDQLAGDASLRKQMGEAARVRFLGRHTVESRAKAVLGS